MKRGKATRGRSRDLRRTSLYLDAADRAYLARLVEFLGLRPTEVLRLGLRTLAYRYGLTKERERSRR